MKQRITYLLPPGSNLQDFDIAVTPDNLIFAKAQNAVEEWKFTLGVEELPGEVYILDIPQFLELLLLREFLTGVLRSCERS